MPKKGYKPTKEHRKNLSLSHIGHPGFWKDKHHSEETRKKISEINKGRHLTEENKKRMSKQRKGNKYALGKHHKLSEETKKKMSLSKIGSIPWNKGLKGDKCQFWKGGISPINNIIRGSLEYKLWSDSVWNRDNNCCQKCSETRISKLVAHHILNFAQYSELRFAIDNGITFCKSCHKEFHKKYGKKNNTKKQVEEFLKIAQ